MNRRHHLQLLAAVCAVTLTATAASASGIVNPVIDFGSGYAQEGTRAVGDHTSTPGDVLCIVGEVAQFNCPFDDLDAMDPGKEYTWVIKNATSLGTVTSGDGMFYFFYDTNYSGGTFEVYCDDTPDADLSNKASYQDGDMIVSGAFSTLYTHTNSIFGSDCGGNIGGEFIFTGGSLYNRVSDGGGGFDGTLGDGLFAVCSSIVNADGVDRGALGYFGCGEPKLDVNPALPVEPTTWGAIKNQFGN